jgi:ribosomal protein S18 acetylase RimI-like enzyme
VIRDARPGDELEVAGVHVRSWQAGYRGLFPDEFLAALSAEERAGRYTFGAETGAPRTLLSLAGGRIAGFATIGASRDEDVPSAGELYALYVDPEHWGRGLGRELLLESRARLHADGHRLAVLWVLEGNAGAERMYLADGWARDGARRSEDPWGILAEVNRFRRELP